MYPVGIQQILCLLFGDRDNIGQVFREEPRASKHGHLQVKRATFDYRLLAFELHRNVRITRKRKKEQREWTYGLTNTIDEDVLLLVEVERGNIPLAFELESLSRDDGLGRL